MINKIKKNIIVIILLIALLILIGCQQKNEFENGWKEGRYNLAANICHADLDKISYDLGTPSARRILLRGWGRDAKSLEGRSYVWTAEKISIIKLPPMSPTPRVLSFQAFISIPPGAFLSLVLKLNGHQLNKVKLLPGYNKYSLPIKGHYFSCKENLLIIEQICSSNNPKKLEIKQKKKPLLAFDKLHLTKKELFKQEESIEDNFIRIHRLGLAGDTRLILMTKPNNAFNYKVFLSNPAELRFSIGLHKEEIAKIQNIEFKIVAKNRKLQEKLLFSQSYRSNIEKLSKGWRDLKVDLSPYTGESISLSFQTNINLKEDCKLDRIYWGNPFIITLQKEQNRKKNVIVYLVDTLRADHLGCYGKFLMKTPNIDSFASEGILFEKAFAQASWTKPSIASLFTSTYPSFHGAITREDVLTETITTLAEILRDNGYATTAFINQPNISADFGFNQGFDSFVQTYHQIKHIPLYSKHMNKLILPWLKENKDNPFFLYIHTLDPHAPYTPPPPYNIMYDNDYSGSVDGSSRILSQIDRHIIKVSQRNIQHVEALYNGEITINDLAFGKLINKLKELQLYDNTLIIFVSDHGEEFYEHKGLLDGYTLYEEQINIPLIMRLPYYLPAGTKISSMVRIIDIMPTILELFSLPVPTQCHGTSLVPLIKGNAKTLAEEVYSEEDLDGKVLQSIRKQDWKLIFYPNTRDLELFNLMKDPKEMQNVAAEYPELTSSLLEQIKRWHQEQIENRTGLDRPKIKKLSEETIKLLKAMGYIH